MTRKQLNVRASSEMRSNLAWLKEHYGENEGEVISRALALLYHLALRRISDPDPVEKRLIEQINLTEQGFIEMSEIQESETAHLSDDERD